MKKLNSKFNHEAKGGHRGALPPQSKKSAPSCPPPQKKISKRVKNDLECVLANLESSKLKIGGASLDTISVCPPKNIVLASGLSKLKFIYRKNRF